MPDDVKSDESPESQKRDEVAELKAALKKEQQEAAAAAAGGSEQPKAGGSLADAQHQKYMNRALGRSTQTNLSKFTNNRLEAIKSPSDTEDGAPATPKPEIHKEVFEKQRTAEAAGLSNNRPVLGLVALLCIAAVGGLLYVNKANNVQSNLDNAKNPQSQNPATGKPSVKGDIARVKFRYNRALTAMTASDYKRALADLKFAYLNDPDDKALYLEKIGECLTRVKDYKGALAASNSLLQLQPDNVSGLLQNAQASYLLGNKLTARDELFKAVKLAPGNADVFLARGSYYNAEKEYTSAEEDLKQALAIQPSLAIAKQKLTAVQASEKALATHAKAKAKVQASAKVDDDDSQPAFTKAESEQLQSSDLNALRQAVMQAMTHRRYLFAVAAAKRCVVVNPNDAQSRKLLSYALINAGDASAAFDQFNAWDSLASLRLDEQIAFGKALTKAGDSQTTSAFFNFLVDNNSTNSSNLLRIAKAADQVGCAPAVDKAVNLGVKLSTGTERYQFLVLMRKVQTNQVGENSVPPAADEPHEKHNQ